MYYAKANTARFLQVVAALGLRQDSPAILNIGCGAFEPARELRQLLPGALIVGVDVAWWLLQPNPNAHIIAADGVHLPFRTSHRFDLIIIRHPDVHQRQKSWAHLLGNIHQHLSEEGKLLISCYTSYELSIIHQILPAMLQQNVSIHKKNDLSPPGLVGHDRHLLIAQPAKVSVPESR